MRSSASSAWALACLLGCAPELAQASRAEALAEQLALSDGTTDHVQVAHALESLRAMGRDAAPAAETLSALLAHRSALYSDRDKVQVIRLRGEVMLTLAAIGWPRSARAALYDTLAHTDERLNAREVGAAARAVRTLGPQGHEFAPYLLEALSLQLAEEEFSLERYDVEFPREEATTVQLESVRALAAVAAASDHEVLRILRQWAADSADTAADPRVVQEARRALETIERGAR